MSDSSGAGGANVSLRPVRSTDASALWSLVAGHEDQLVGMTALPHREDHAALLAQRSESTLLDLAAGRFGLAEGEHRPVYFLIVEEADGHERLLGVTGIEAKRGVLNLAVHIRTSDDGAGLVARSSSTPWTRTELNSSFLAPEARSRGIGTLLSRGRLLFLLLAGPQLPSLIVTHIRGVFDDDGTAPFWRAFGARFLPEWPTSTDAERALQDDPRRIAALSRRTIELTPEVLSALGPVNSASLPAFHLLRREDLRPNGMYDPVDGGPSLARPLNHTDSARRRLVGTLEVVDELDRSVTRRGLVSRLALADFIAVDARFAVLEHQHQPKPRIVVRSAVADRLRLRPGDGVSAVPLETGDGDG